MTLLIGSPPASKTPATSLGSSLRVPKYRCQKRSGRNASPLAFVEVNARRIYLGIYGTPESRQAYRRLVAEYEASGSVYFSQARNYG